jgi:hypothetical protein
MISKSNWVSVILAVFFHLSCSLFTLNVLFSSLLILGGEDVPRRNFAIFVFALVLWLIIAYFTQEVWWKTVLKMFVYSSSILAVCMFFYCVFTVINYFKSPESKINLTYVPLFMILSVFLYLGSIKVLRSKFLK